MQLPCLPDTRPKAGIDIGIDIIAQPVDGKVLLTPDGDTLSFDVFIPRFLMKWQYV